MFLALPAKQCSHSRQPHFPSMGDYLGLRAEAQLQHTNTAPSYLPTDHHTQNTHTHTLKTPASTHNNGAGYAAARRRHSGRKPRKRPLLCVFSWLRRNKLAARAATTKTSRIRTFHCKRLLNYFSETERNNKSEDFFSAVRGYEVRSLRLWRTLYSTN